MIWISLYGLTPLDIVYHAKQNSNAKIDFRWWSHLFLQYG